MLTHTNWTVRCSSQFPRSLERRNFLTSYTICVSTPILKFGMTVSNWVRQASPGLALFTQHPKKSLELEVPTNRYTYPGLNKIGTRNLRVPWMMMMLRRLLKKKFRLFPFHFQFLHHSGDSDFLYTSTICNRMLLECKNIALAQHSVPESVNVRTGEFDTDSRGYIILQ